MMYYRKGNRDELLMSVIFPVVQLLNKSYSRKNYDELLSIKSNYAIRYLGKKERRTLMLLIEQYSIVCQYNRSKKDTDCILSYFDFKLGEIITFGFIFKYILKYVAHKIIMKGLQQKENP